MEGRYRAVSWWLDWNDMMWPSPAIVEKIQRRADQAAEASVNCVMIFGMHFRWDHLPLWERLHDLLAHTVEELHTRNIAVFDHHSAVLTHRPRSQADAWDIYRRNRHHVPFYPSQEAAATWTYAGQALNSWRMTDVETGQAAYMPTYVAEQFCMNNPGFRQAYQGYVRKLVAETGIDGLMSDDCIHYGGWRTCGCPHCRERFQRDYGRELPPVGDTSFWGNRDSEAFKDWIAMRFADSGGFLAGVRAALPAGFPLLSCCSTSDYAAAPSSGLTYQEYIKHCSLVMLEMCGNTPSLQGSWSGQMASQLLHLAVARDHASPCLGMGHGFYPDAAFFVWALNKFLGSDTWFSTLPGRLAGPPEELAALADDPALVGEGFGWEKEHAELFAGQPEAALAVYFSRATRDYYGQVHEDYTADYQQTCTALVEAGVDFEVVTDVPDAKAHPTLALACAACLSAAEIDGLEAYLRAGGWLIACGPTGLRDERARPRERGWLERFGLRLETREPERQTGFPPYLGQGGQAECLGWLDGAAVDGQGWAQVGRLVWSPGRPSRAGFGAALAEKAVSTLPVQDPRVTSAPAGWALRRFRDAGGWSLIGLPRQVAAVAHERISNAFTREAVIARIDAPALDGQTLQLEFERPPARLRLNSPDLAAPVEAQFEANGQARLDLGGVRRFFVARAEWE